MNTKFDIVKNHITSKNKAFTTGWQRINWLDGLKGLACIGIFIHHFLLFFLPSTYYGLNASSHIKGGTDTYFAQSPLSFLFTGNFLVCIFFLVSGFIISIRTLSIDDKKNVADVIIKRYFKLAFPIFVVCFFVYIMNYFSLFSEAKNVSALTGSKWITFYYNKDLSIKDVFYSAFIKIWFVGDDSFSTAFWMLKDLFIGCYLSIILSEIIWKIDCKMKCATLIG